MNWEKDNFTWLTNMSGEAYVDIVNMTVDTSLQHTTTRSLYLLVFSSTLHRRRRVRAYISDQASLRLMTDLKCITSIVWKKLPEMLSRSLQKEYLFLDLVSTHSQSRTRQHMFSNESSNGCPLWLAEHKFPCDNTTKQIHVRKLSLRHRV